MRVKNKEWGWGGGVKITPSSLPFPATYPNLPLSLPMKHGVRINDLELITLTRPNKTPALLAKITMEHYYTTDRFPFLETVGKKKC